MLAVGALNLAAGKLVVALQMLLALRTGEFQLVHGAFSLVMGA
jgi:hypothetical protein